MSRIDTLVKQYCSDGVTFKHLWELTTWDKKFNAVDNSKQPRVIKYHYLLANELKPLIVENGDVKLLTTNTSDLWTTEDLAGNKVSDGEVVAIPWGGNPNVQYYKGKFLTADNRIATSNDVTVLDNKYLYYYLLNNIELIGSFYRGSGIKHPSMNKVLDMKIPVPPLTIQREIVDILEKFTQLEAELTAELTARKRQYEFYRNKLLNFEQQNSAERERDVRWLTMTEICAISRGRVMSKDYLAQNVGEYPVYSSQTANDGVFGQINSYDYEGEYLTWTTDGANAGSVFYRNGKFSITNVCGLLTTKTPEVSLRYLYYALGRVAKKYVSSGMGNPKLMSNVMATIKVQVPSLEEQGRIVAVLDKFDKLVHDVSEGLPAEIDARRKQYEYYRNKLLTFKEC